MDVTKSQHPNSMVLASARIELASEGIEIDRANKKWSMKALTDLGLARGIKIGFASSKIDIKADNGTVPLKGQTDMKASVEFSLLERHLPLLGKIMAGIVTVDLVPGEKQNKTDTALANTLVKGTWYEFASVGVDALPPAAIVIKNASATLVNNTDYEIGVSAQGLPAYRFLAAGAFDATKATTISYEVTPIKSYSLSKGSGGVVKNIAMILTNKRKSVDGRVISRSFEFPYGFYDGEDAIALKSKNDTDPVSEVPMKFEFSPHPDLVSDETLERSSLYRESQEA